MATGKVIAIAAVIGLIAAPALADWDPGDGHKMHYPQLPDPNGWDVNITRDFMFDDWQCTGSGPVDDIHFWGSWKGDNVGTFARIFVKIWSDVPANDPDNQLGYSHPGEELWQHMFYPPEFTIRGPEYGDQGWFDPQPEVVVNPHDHDLYYQINFENILNPFVQEQDTIYWLAIHTIPVEVGPEFGWKTSQDHWNDDAVFYWGGSWHELIDPEYGTSLDLAFVITPEPATLSLLALGGLLAVRRRR